MYADSAAWRSVIDDEFIATTTTLLAVTVASAASPVVMRFTPLFCSRVPVPVIIRTWPAFDARLEKNLGFKRFLKLFLGFVGFRFLT